MNTKEYVDAVRTVVYIAAVQGILTVLKQPPGRCPDPDMLKLSDWYNQLRPQDRDNVARIADMAAKQATYNYLLTLDGLLAVEPEGEKGKLELFYNDGKRSTRLNDDEGYQLSYLFKKTESCEK